MKNYTGGCFRTCFWGLVAVAGGLLMVLGLEIPAITPLGTGIMCIAMAKLGLYQHREFLRDGNRFFIKFKNSFPLFLVFNLLLILVTSAAFTLHGSRPENFFGDSHEGKNLFIIFLSVFSLFGVMMTWGMFLNLPLIGFGNFLKVFKKYFRNYVFVFIVYQLVFSVISFICSSITILAGRGFENAGLEVNGYMALISGNSPDDTIGNSALSIISTLTAGSSYFVLSTMAQESIDSTEDLTFPQRLRRMLFDSDTLQVLIMTVICIVTCAVSGFGGGRISSYIMIGCCIFWLISLIIFCSQTRLLWYLMNLTIMTFMEYAVPAPEITGFASVLLTIPTLVVRILLFSIMALMIGWDHRNQQIRAQMVASGQVQETIVDKANKHLYGTSILKAGLKTADVIINRKDYIDDAKNKLKKAAIDKLTGKR